MSGQTNAIAVLEERFDTFAEGFIQKIVTENNVDSVGADRLREMLRYNCIGGKYFRGASVVTFAKMVCDLQKKDFAAIETKVYAMGWAVEVLQAYFLIADDMMDKSHTRRGQICWYLRPDVQNDAINDCFITESFMIHLIETYVTEPTEFITITKLFQDVKLKTELGQMIDLLSQPQGRKGADILNSFSLDLHSRIVKYKTAFYTFYLPAALGLILGGISSKESLKAVEEICMEIGEKFQIQDDYLDCYQDPTILGKIGTDIQDHKCSWLVVKALDLVNEDQKKVLFDNYGRDEPERIQRIKDLYKELDLSAVYEKQETDSLERLNSLLEKNKDLVSPTLFEEIIARVHGRQK